jgi:phenylalanyl-tRNA synthetase alpha chain
MAQDIFAQIEQLQQEIAQQEPQDMAALEAFRIQYLGSKNVFKSLSPLVKEIAPELRKQFGQQLNAAMQAAQAKFDALKDGLQSASAKASVEKIDVTATAWSGDMGSRHPVSLVMNEMISIFERIGFTVAEERELEDDWHNFTALGTPADHPARDMQDTFYLLHDPATLLRTHTSSIQVRFMEKQKPPIRILAPGRVYRNETISSRAHCQFHQIEGLYVAENVSFADLRQTIYFFAKEMFGATKIRMRPSFFPFTEPSAEVDVYWGLNSEADHRITKGTGWLEILGCGMIDPLVLENCGIDSQRYTGFAFGLGVERIAMLKYQIDDIRLLFENDVRFLKQFSAADVL